VTAHEVACERRAKLRKLARISHVRQSAIDRIIHGWSPQQIAGRMRSERHPISVSHETIYKFPYSAGGHAIGKDICRRIVSDADHDMPDGNTANGLARTPTSCAAQMSLPIANSLDIGNAI
jgi:IS30 family transposase